MIAPNESSPPSLPELLSQAAVCNLEVRSDGDNGVMIYDQETGQMVASGPVTDLIQLYQQAITAVSSPR
jgi:hypothetical protein